MRNFVTDFWSCLLASTIFAGIGTGLLYFALFSFSRILITPTLCAVLGGACICAAYIFAALAISRRP
jgi:hypothetical protein